MTGQMHSTGILPHRGKKPNEELMAAEREARKESAEEYNGNYTGKKCRFPQQSKEVLPM